MLTVRSWLQCLDASWMLRNNFHLLKKYAYITIILCYGILSCNAYGLNDDTTFIIVYNEFIELVRGDVVLKTYKYDKQNDNANGIELDITDGLCRNLRLKFGGGNQVNNTEMGSTTPGVDIEIIDSGSSEKGVDDVTARTIAIAILEKLKACESDIGGTIEMDGDFKRIFDYDDFTIICEYTPEPLTGDTITIRCYETHSNVGLKQQGMKRKRRNVENVRKLNLNEYNIKHLKNKVSNVVGYVNDI